MLAIASAVVSSHGFRDPAANPARAELAREIARSAAALGTRLAILPAGFLLAAGDDAVAALAAELAAPFVEAGIALIAGIDVADPERRGGKVESATTEARIREGRLPHFVFAADGARRSGPFRQRSSTAPNAAMAPLDDSARVIEIDGARIALSACGELFSAPLRAAMIAAAPDLIIDIAHVGHGRTFQLVLPRLAKESGAWVLSVAHNPENNPAPTKWRVDPAGVSRSEIVPHASLGTRRAGKPLGKTTGVVGLWAELVKFEIPARERAP